MTIKELIQELQKIENQDIKVILSSDQEGNDFGECSKSFGLWSFSNDMQFQDEKGVLDFDAVVLFPN